MINYHIKQNDRRQGGMREQDNIIEMIYQLKELTALQAEDVKEFKDFISLYRAKEEREQQRWAERREKLIGILAYGLLGWMGKLIIEALHIKF